MPTQEEYNELVALLLKWSKAYYQTGTSEVSDAVFDAKYQELLGIEKEHPDWVQLDSPSQKVGAPTIKGFHPHEHALPMLSIRTETETNVKGVQDFLNKIQEEVAEDARKLIGEVKYDGVALSLGYKNGALVSASTRGDGISGENVIRNARMIPCIPATLTDPQVYFVEVRGEVILHNADFEAINKALVAEGKKPYTNARNAVSGILRTHDTAAVAKMPLKFYAYGIGGNTGMSEKSQTDLLAQFRSWGFLVYDWFTPAFDAASVLAVFEQLGQTRKTIPFNIDGFVLKLDSFAGQKKMGFVSREPRWAVAFKFPAEEAITELIAIDVQVGRTGKLTPVARLNPVFVSGTTISNVTLHNLFDIRGRGVRVGDTVIIRRAGDVIPEIAGPVKDLRKDYLKNYWMPEQCPVCGGPVKRSHGEREYRCINSTICPAQLKRAIEHYAHKRAMDIEGLGEVMVSNLVDAGLVTNLLDIYTLTKEKLLTLDGVGEQTAQNLLNAIEASKTVSFRRFLFALGIPNTGEGTAKRLSAHYENVVVLADESVENLQKIPDIGPIVAQSIYDFFHDSKNYAVALALWQSYLKIEKPTLQSTSLAGKSFVLTGTLPTLSRDGVKALIEAHGGSVMSSVGPSTSYLLAGAGGGDKLKKATKLSIPIIDEDAFKQLIAE